MKQTHIHHEINLSSIRAIRLSYPISLHKTSTLNNASYHFNYCTIWTTLNTTCITCWTHWRIFYALVVFKIGNYCITFILHCLPKSEYRPMICFHHYYVMFIFPSRIFFRGFPDFATDCPCNVWCRWLTTCLLYVGQLFGKLIKMIVDL